MSTTIESARTRRLKMNKAANHLEKMSLHLATSTDDISHRMIGELPEWCCNDINTIRDIQRTCGALYFSPVVATSIDGQMLREFMHFVGDECFTFIRNQYQSDHTVTADIKDQRLPISVMAAGSAVLLSTLPDQQLVLMYEQMIGPRSIKVPQDAGNKILRDCDFLLLEKPALAIEQ